MKRLVLSVLLSCAVLCSIAKIAQAQTDTAPPPSAPSRSSGTHGGGPFGVGGIAYLSGITGLSLAYDPGAWHLDTMVGLSGGGNAANVIQLGGRFWYHLANSGSADLSVGGGFAYQHIGSNGGAASASNLFIEVGGLIRVFLTSNVALGTGAGFVIATADASGYNLGSTNLTGNAAIHYYF